MTALMAFLEVTIYMHFQEDIEGVFNKEKDALNLYGIHARFGRYRGIDELRKPLPDPDIRISLNKQSVTIEIEFSDQESRLAVLQRYAKPKIGLADTFDRILGLPNGHETIEGTLSNSAKKAYAEAQKGLMELYLLGRAPRGADRSTQEMLNSIFQPLYARRRGRGEVSASRRRLLQKLYEYYLPYAEQIHKSAVKAAAGKNKYNEDLKTREFHSRLRQELDPETRGWEFMRAVIAGEVFNKMRMALREDAALEHPRTWNARQLTVGLVANTLGKGYETVQKALAERKR
jgi:hypothetical protein